jgi:hypothetical protein
VLNLFDVVINVNVLLNNVPGYNKPVDKNIPVRGFKSSGETIRIFKNNAHNFTLPDNLNHQPRHLMNLKHSKFIWPPDVSEGGELFT